MLTIAASFILALNVTPNPMLPEGGTSSEVHYSMLSEGYDTDVHVCSSYGTDCIVAPVPMREGLGEVEWAGERVSWEAPIYAP